MSNEPLSEDIKFARLLKIIVPYLSEYNLTSLQKWNFVYLAYQASWALFFSYSTEENAVEVKIKSDDLFAIEDTLNDVISIIFLETPDPKIVAGNWDGGKEKEIAKERKNTIISIKKMTAERYAELRLQVSSIDEMVRLQGI
ncbi:MAG: hypothetical protein COA42_15130 [Alteromonadaceae bacterium]|nr:MAG: hypothetical protein COA42_15130 [Alteromonadaceae bacterium]